MKDERSKVPMVSERDLYDVPESDDTTLRLTSLRVTPAAGQNAVVVSAGFFSSGEPDGLVRQIVLSPPAATQLADKLRKAVKEYLRSTPWKQTCRPLVL